MENQDQITHTKPMPKSADHNLLEKTMLMGTTADLISYFKSLPAFDLSRPDDNQEGCFLPFQNKPEAAPEYQIEGALASVLPVMLMVAIGYGDLCEFETIVQWVMITDRVEKVKAQAAAAPRIITG